MKKGLYLFLIFLTLIGCSPKGPEPINPGKDICEYCKMVITDIKFASEIITKTGKVYKYDSIECAAADYLAKKDQVKAIYVPNYDNPMEFILAEKAFYLVSDNLRSPMGLNVSAYPDRESAEMKLKTKGGKIYDWEGITVLVQMEFIPRFSNMHIYEK
jgi:copper chaperone NosL